MESLTASSVSSRLCFRWLSEAATASSRISGQLWLAGWGARAKRNSRYTCSAVPCERTSARCQRPFVVATSTARFTGSTRQSVYLPPVTLGSHCRTVLASTGATVGWTRSSACSKKLVQGRRRDIGLGGFPAVSLAKAREQASEHREAVAEGRDPVNEKRKPAPRVPTFREAAAAVVEINAPRWRAPKHATSWSQSLERHAMPRLGDMPVDRITRADVLAVLTPIWGTRQETARRVRQRVRAVMRWAMAHGHRDDNPAGEGIDGALPPMPAIRAHFRALPYREVPAALETIAASTAGGGGKSVL